MNPPTADANNPLKSAIAAKRVLVCVGAGGVGKTTVSAALGVRAAMANRSALVCTIDPARRLANALGLRELGNTETRIPDSALHQAGIHPGAPLFGMMLDMKQSWDAFIEKNTPPDQREKILGNRLYQSISTRLAGSQEYIAMEKLWELRNRNDYDVLVLDTPPTAHALDFLEAPKRVLDFFDNDAARFLMTPALLAGKVGLQFLHLGGSFATKTLAKLTGVQLLQDIANLLLATRSLHDTFRERAKGVRQMLEAPESTFVLVTTPNPERLNEAIRFHQLLKESALDIAAIVVNRVQISPSAEQKAAAASAPSPTRERLLETLAEQSKVAEEDTRGIAMLQTSCAGTPLIQVPRFELDVHDIEGLSATAKYLVGERQVPSDTLS